MVHKQQEEKEKKPAQIQARRPCGGECRRIEAAWFECSLSPTEMESTPLKSFDSAFYSNRGLEPGTVKKQVQESLRLKMTGKANSVFSFHLPLLWKWCPPGPNLQKTSGIWSLNTHVFIYLSPLFFCGHKHREGHQILSFTFPLSVQFSVQGCALYLEPFCSDDVCNSRLSCHRYCLAFMTKCPWKIYASFRRPCFWPCFPLLI